MLITDKRWEEAVKFHGHVCPGLALGVRAAEITLDRLKVARAEDEELVAIVETDACGVDGIQVLTGCTFGKGNLFFRDYGKQAFTLVKRKNGQGCRAVFTPAARFSEDKASLRKKVMEGMADEAEREQFKQMQLEQVKRLLAAPPEEICTVQDVTIEVPRPARIFDSVQCEKCGEYFMEPRARRQEGKTVCLQCFEEYLTGKGD